MGGAQTTADRSPPSDLDRHYTVTETVLGYGLELGITTVRTYDVMGNLVELEDPNGNVYSFSYDALYRQVERTEPISGTATTTYTLNGDPVTDTDFLGNTTIRAYDSMNRVIEDRRPVTSGDIVTTYSYDPAGQVEFRTDPEQNVFEYRYDEALRLVLARFDINDLAYEESYEYGPNSGSGAFSYIDGWQPTRVVNRRGFPTDTVYDGFYRPVQVIQRESPTTPYGSPPSSNEPTTDHVFNDVHNEIRRTVRGEPEAGGDRTTYTFYDALHRVLGTAIDFDGDGGYGGSSGIVPPGFTGDPDDQVTVFQLDLSGNRTGITDPEGNFTETLFDGASRPYLVRQPAVSAGVPETETVYDDNGNPVLVTDPNGNVTRVDYDERNREILRILDLNGDGFFDPTFGGDDIVSSQDYDVMDNVQSRTDSRGFTYNYVYDEAYREIERLEPEVRDPENGNQPTRPLWQTVYDQNSNVVQQVDPRLVTKSMAYDGLNRLVGETSALGTPEQVTTTYEYDENGNLVAQTLDNDSFGLQRTEFSYDSFDRQELETWPGGMQTAQSYFRNNLLNVKEDPKAQKVLYEYDIVGRVETATFTEFDGGLDQPIEQRTFTYDKADNLLTVTDLYGSSVLTYDALYRLIGEERTYLHPKPYTYEVAHDYDLNGNRVETVYPYGGRIVQYEFDRRDRLKNVLDFGTAAGAGDDQVTTYVYDTNSNVVACMLPNGVDTTNRYDPLNRRIVTSSESATRSIYSASYLFDLVGNRLRIKEKVHGTTGASTAVRL